MPKNHSRSDRKSVDVPSRSKSATTVTLRHLGTALSASHDLPKKQANAVLEDMVALIAKHLKKGDRIRIGGLGILQVRKRPARMGRNPATGEAIKIKPSKTIAFHASKELDWDAGHASFHTEGVSATARKEAERVRNKYLNASNSLLHPRRLTPLQRRMRSGSA